MLSSASRTEGRPWAQAIRFHDPSCSSCYFFFFFAHAKYPCCWQELIGPNCEDQERCFRVYFCFEIQLPPIHNQQALFLAFGCKVINRHGKKATSGSVFRYIAISQYFVGFLLSLVISASVSELCAESIYLLSLLCCLSSST